MRTLSRTVAVALTVVLLAACGTIGGGVPADVAATVNGEQIPRDLVERIVEAQLDNPEVPAEGDERAQATGEIQRGVLSTLIGVEIVAQLAEREGLEVDPSVLDDLYAEQVEAAGGQEAFDAFLGTIGLSDEEYRDIIVRDIARRDALTARFSEEVTDEAVQALYDERAVPQIDSRHILVETEDEANDVLARLDGGEDFADLAAELSTDGSAAQGGDLGPSDPGRFVPEFTEALTENEVGDVVGPVETQFGFHVIEILEELPAPTFEELEPELRAELEQQSAQSPELAAAFEEAFTGAEVEVGDGFGEWDPQVGQVVDPDAVGEGDPAEQAPDGGVPSDDSGGVPSDDSGGVPSDDEPITQEEMEQMLEELESQLPGDGETPPDGEATDG